MHPGTWTLLITVAGTLAIGLLWRLRTGRVRPARGRQAAGRLNDNRPDSSNLESREGTVLDHFPEGLRHLLAEPEQPSAVTLLQFSSTFCAPCRHTRILLGALAERTGGVRHVEVDLTHHPEWSTPLRVHTTPTTLVLDPEGTELFRVSGVPRRAELAKALAPHLP